MRWEKEKCQVDGQIQKKASIINCSIISDLSEDRSDLNPPFPVLLLSPLAFHPIVTVTVLGGPNVHDLLLPLS